MQPVHAKARLRRFVRGVALLFGVGGVGAGEALGVVDQFADFEGVASALGLFGGAA